MYLFVNMQLNQRPITVLRGTRSTQGTLKRGVVRSEASSPHFSGRVLQRVVKQCQSGDLVAIGQLAKLE